MMPSPTQRKAECHEKQLRHASVLRRCTVIASLLATFKERNGIWGLITSSVTSQFTRLWGNDRAGNLHTGVYTRSVLALPMDHLKQWSVKYVLLSPSKSMFAFKLAAAGFEERTIRDGGACGRTLKLYPNSFCSGLRPAKLVI